MESSSSSSTDAEYDEIAEVGAVNLNNDGEDAWSDTSNASRVDRTPYDPQSNVDHLYLSRGSNWPSTSRESFAKPEAGTHLFVPIFFSSAVVLPGQTVPLTGGVISDELLSESLDKKYPYIGVITVDVYRPYYPVTDVGVLVQIKTLGKNHIGFWLVGSACQRFRLKRRIEDSEIETLNLPSAFFYLARFEVMVLDEIMLMPFDYDPACSFNRLGNNKIKKNYLRSLFALSPKLVGYRSTETAVKLLTQWLSLFVKKQKIENALKQGLEIFSFWVVCNIPMNSTKKLSYLADNCVDSRLSAALYYISRTSFLNCICGSMKIEIKDLIDINPDSLGTCYVNLGGNVYDLFTTNRIYNVDFIGHSHSQFSWFPGYAWTIMNCTMCLHHVGWMFTSSRLKPSKFYAIIRNVLQSNEPQEEL